MSQSAPTRYPANIPCSRLPSKKAGSSVIAPSSNLWSEFAAPARTSSRPTSPKTPPGCFESFLFLPPLDGSTTPLGEHGVASVLPAGEQRHFCTMQIANPGDPIHEHLGNPQLALCHRCDLWVD